MGRKKLSMSERVRRYCAANPSAKPKDIAEKLGIPIVTVYAARYKRKDKAPAKDAAPKTWTTVATWSSNTPAPTPKIVDMVNQPPHYTDGGIETIDFLAAKLSKEEFVGYLKGNVLKYGSRLGKKGSSDIDAGKMAWYAVKLRDVLSTHA